MLEPPGVQYFPKNCWLSFSALRRAGHWGKNHRPLDRAGWLKGMEGMRQMWKGCLFVFFLKYPLTVFIILLILRSSRDLTNFCSEHEPFDFSEFWEPMQLLLVADFDKVNKPCCRKQGKTSLRTAILKKRTVPFIPRCALNPYLVWSTKATLVPW